VRRVVQPRASLSRLSLRSDVGTFNGKISVLACRRQEKSSMAMVKKMHIPLVLASPPPLNIVNFTQKVASRAKGTFCNEDCGKRGFTLQKTALQRLRKCRTAISSMLVIDLIETIHEMLSQ